MPRKILHCIMTLTSLHPPLVSYPYEVNSFITRPHPPSLSMDQTELFRAMVKAVRLRMKAQRRESGSLSDSFLLTKSTRKTTLFATQARDVVSLLCFIVYMYKLPLFRFTASFFNLHKSNRVAQTVNGLEIYSSNSKDICSDKFLINQDTVTLYRSCGI